MTTTPLKLGKAKITHSYFYNHDASYMIQTMFGNNYDNPYL